jgi:hypothetical protein
VGFGGGGVWSGEGGAITLQFKSISFSSTKKKCPCSLYTIRFLGFEKFMLKKYTLFATGKLLAVHP